jgi:hypothetical protein
MKTIAEKNSTIADFMGLTPVESFGKFSVSQNHCTCREDTIEKTMEGFGSVAKYHESWDWLMPVVRKINEHGYDLEGTALVRKIAIFAGEALLEPTYDAVVAFIEYHNSGRMKVKHVKKNIVVAAN